MDFGIFTEQIRRGSSQGEWFQELLDLADAGEQWGLDVVWLAEMLVNPARSVPVGAPAGGELDRGPHAPPARGDGRAAPAAESPAPRRRRGRDARSPESRALRLRDRAQRRTARLRRASAFRTRRARRDFFEALESHPDGVEGRALQLRGQVLSLHRDAPSHRARISSPIRRSAWPRRPPRRFRRSAGWVCRSSWDLRGMSIPELSVHVKTLSRSLARGRSSRRRRACASAFPCTPPRPRRPRWTSRRRRSRTTSSVRPI